MIRNHGNMAISMISDFLGKWLHFKGTKTLATLVLDPKFDTKKHLVKVKFRVKITSMIPLCSSSCTCYNLYLKAY